MSSNHHPAEYIRIQRPEYKKIFVFHADRANVGWCDLVRTKKQQQNTIPDIIQDYSKYVQILVMSCAIRNNDFRTHKHGSPTP
jgi:hypothetical protein